MKSKKVRRHSGRYTPRIALKEKFSEMIANAEEPLENYDDWRDYRDGIRINTDKTKIRNERVNYAMEKKKIKMFNKRLKNYFLIRLAKKARKFFSPQYL